MKETEFLRKRNIISKDKTDLIIGFDNGTEESLIGLLKEYHESELKKLRVTDVSRRSEQLVCDMCGSSKLEECGSNEYSCEECGHFPITN